MANVIFWSGIFPPANNSAALQGRAVFYGYQVQRPIGSYQLSWWLRQHRFSCQVIEFIQLLTTEELIELTEPFIKNDTLVLGISTVFWPPDGSIPQPIFEAIDYFRSRYPKLKIIAGGDAAGRESYKCLNFDKTFSLDSENSLLLYLQELKHSIRLPNQQFDITQLEHRFIRNDVILDNEVLPIELGRGCIFKCKFCNYVHIGKKKHTYQRKFDYIIDELKYNKENFNTSNYIFLDDTVNEDMEKVRNMSTFSKRLGFDINWIGYLRADLLYRYSESAELLQESGLLSPYFGLETFHPTAATAIGKGWNGKKAKDWLPVLYNDIWKKEINIFGNFILGLPGETTESWVETFKWCMNNSFGQWNFYPLILKVYGDDQSTKSEFDKNYQQYGYEVSEDNSWKLGNLTKQTAAEHAVSFNRSLYKTNRIAGFASANIINLGYSLDHIKHVMVSDVIHTSQDKILEFKERYLKQFREIIKKG